MTRYLLWAPLAAFVALFAIIAFGLRSPADRTVRSAMIGRTVPDFTLPPIATGKPGASAADLRRGTPRLINVFASWCVPCVAEAPQLMQLKSAGVSIDGIAIRDTRADLDAFLQRNGDPYATIGDDKASRVQLSLGSSGVPESFVVDGKGTILLQHVGDIRADDVPAILTAIRGAR